MKYVLCASNSSNMKYYFNEERYGILPKPVKDELKRICVAYTSDVGGIIALGFDEEHHLKITTMDPIDEIGAELKVGQIQRQQSELFSKLEEFSKAFFDN